MNYTHLTQEERYQISTLLREGFSKRYIVCRLNRPLSTISREISRNRARNGYFAQHANKLARKRQHPNPKRISREVWAQVMAYLELQWSPKQITSHVAVSLHSIYRFMRYDKSKGGTLFHHLRFRNQRKRKYGSPKTRGQLTNRKSICALDLEIDTIVGKSYQ